MSNYSSSLKPLAHDNKINRRAEERKPVTTEAVILGSDRQEFVSATIVDRSESGAKLRIDRACFFARSIILVELHSGSVFDCEVRWHQDCYLGVHIIDVYGSARRRRFFETHKLVQRRLSSLP